MVDRRKDYEKVLSNLGGEDMKDLKDEETTLDCFMCALFPDICHGYKDDCEVRTNDEKVKAESKETDGKRTCRSK